MLVKVFLHFLPCGSTKNIYLGYYLAFKLNDENFVIIFFMHPIRIYV